MKSLFKSNIMLRFILTFNDKRIYFKHILFLSVFTFSSCLDVFEDNLNPGFSSVRILDQISHKPIENAVVTLEDHLVTGFLSTQLVGREIKLSDKEGKVKFSKTYNQDTHIYYLEIQESEHYFPNYIEIVHHENEIIYQKPKAWLRIHAKDFNPNDGFERLVISSQSFYGRYLEVTGQQIDTTKLFIAYPKDSAELQIENYKNAENIKYSIFTPITAYDTIDINVYFK